MLIFQVRSIRHLYHSEPDDLVPQREAGSEDLGDGILSQALILDVHDSVVEIGVEGLAQGWDLGDAQLGEDLLELVHRHLHPLFEGGVGGVLLQGPLQVVIDGEERLDGIRLGAGPEALLLLGGALAVVVIFGGQAEELLLGDRQLLGRGSGLLRGGLRLGAGGIGLYLIRPVLFLQDLGALGLGDLWGGGRLFILLTNDSISIKDH